MRQFVVYALFAIGWPLLVALVYSQLERIFPGVLLPEHATADDKTVG